MVFPQGFSQKLKVKPRLTFVIIMTLSLYEKEINLNNCRVMDHATYRLTCRNVFIFKLKNLFSSCLTQCFSSLEMDCVVGNWQRPNRKCVWVFWRIFQIMHYYYQLSWVMNAKVFFFFLFVLFGQWWINLNYNFELNI